MAPPDKEKGKQDGNGSGSGGNDDGSGSDGRSNPCDYSGSPSAVDQDHKACDEHTAGELIWDYDKKLFSAAIYFWVHRVVGSVLSIVEVSRIAPSSWR